MLIVKNTPVENDVRDFSVVLRDDRDKCGRTEGSKNIPPFLRNTIAVAAQHDSNANVARAFGISKQEVSILKNARLAQSKDEFGKDIIDRNSPANAALSDAVGNDLLKIRELAASKLLLSLQSMSQERINAIPKLTEAAQFAESMSKIIERVSPKDKENNGDGNAKFVFIVPEGRKALSEYNIIEVEQPLD